MYIPVSFYDFGDIVYILVYEAACAIFLPLPSEAPMFLFVNLSRATVLVACALGKACGAYVVFRSGDAVRQSAFFIRMIRAVEFERVWLSMTIWSKKFMHKYGFLGFLFLMSIPGMPMRSAIYSVSMLGINALQFSIGSAAGTVIRNLLVYWGYLSLRSLFLQR